MFFNLKTVLLELGGFWNLKSVFIRTFGSFILKNCQEVSCFGTVLMKMFESLLFKIDFNLKLIKCFS